MNNKLDNNKLKTCRRHHSLLSDGPSAIWAIKSGVRSSAKSELTKIYTSLIPFMPRKSTTSTSSRPTDPAIWASFTGYVFGRYRTILHQSPSLLISFDISFHLPNQIKNVALSRLREFAALRMPINRWENCYRRWTIGARRSGFPGRSLPSAA